VSLARESQELVRAGIINQTIGIKAPGLREAPSLSQDNGQGSFGLRLIGGFKFACGLLLVGLGVGLFRQAHADPAVEVERIVAALRIDPESHYIHEAISKVSGIKPAQLRAIGVGTFLYALMYLVEGTGLLLRKRWAEYVTVIATGLFIPLELYEVFRSATLIRLAILAINLAILVYLIVQLTRNRRTEPVT
jgi:uncharacterized membrane protein (DUF2068 family)